MVTDIKSISTMKKDLFTFTLPAWAVAIVQVALLEADLQARADNRQADSAKYLNIYKLIGTEKRRAQA